ncbi:MAG: transcriptional regulator [Sterolibacterium sp.]|nr:transcriptional regulator [Sterolibacterium sp.]
MTTKSKLKALPKDLTEFRKNLGLNQSDFWSRYGVTQSGGSRYESGRNMPMPMKLLIRLHLSGVISDDALKAAKAK